MESILLQLSEEHSIRCSGRMEFGLEPMDAAKIAAICGDVYVGAPITRLLAGCHTCGLLVAPFE